jgi:hypothetical protein
MSHLDLAGWFPKCFTERREDRTSIHPEAKNVTKNIKGLMNALHQSINEAILESNDVAAALAALKRTGKCPVFTIDITMQDAPEAAAEPVVSSVTEELVLSDSDVQFLAVIGISDPSWCCSTSQSDTP